MFLGFLLPFALASACGLVELARVVEDIGILLVTNWSIVAKQQNWKMTRRYWNYIPAEYSRIQNPVEAANCLRFLSKQQSVKLFTFKESNTYQVLSTNGDMVCNNNPFSPKNQAAIKWQVLGNFPVCFSDSLVLFLGFLGVLAALAAVACSASGPGGAGGAFSERTSAAAEAERRSLASVSCSKAAILGVKVWMFFGIF